jgi:hypothetical protein
MTPSATGCLSRHRHSMNIIHDLYDNDVVVKWVGDR